MYGNRWNRTLFEPFNFGQNFQNHTYRTLFNDLSYLPPINGSEIERVIEKRPIVMILKISTEIERLEECLISTISIHREISLKKSVLLHGLPRTTHI